MLNSHVHPSITTRPVWPHLAAARAAQVVAAAQRAEFDARIAALVAECR